MKEITFTEMADVSGAGSEIYLTPLPGTDAPTTGDAPFVPESPDIKKMMFQTILYTQET